MTGDQTQKRVNRSTRYLGKQEVEMNFTFFVVFFFSIKPSIIICHGSLTWFELEKKKKRIRENAMYVKLNLYFFYKNTP